jgi:MFS family permease
VELLYGIAHGCGTGLAYISVTSALQRWFPEFKGLATGVAVMGFGLGSFIWTTLGKNLMTPLATNPYSSPPLAVYQVQGIFAATFLGGLLLALPFLREPPPDYRPDTHKYAAEASLRGALVRLLAGAGGATTPATARAYSFVEALCTQEMALLAFVFFTAEITGLVFLSSAADMVQNTFGLSPTDSAAITSYLNLVNFAGRVAWGFLSDKLGRKPFFLLSLATQALCVGTMAIWISWGASATGYSLWLASFLTIGSLYGGGFGVIPAMCSDLFGARISAATHGVMIGAWAAAAIVGIPCFTTYTSTDYRLVGGSKVTNPTAYISNAHWLCALPSAGFLACLFLCVNPVDRALQHSKGDWRVRLHTHVLRLSLAEGVRLLSPMQVAAEHAALLAAQAEQAEQAALAGKAGGEEEAGGAAEQPVLHLKEVAPPA